MNENVFISLCLSCILTVPFFSKELTFGKLRDKLVKIIIKK